ncbi:MAG: DUF4349 domain-containing protein [Solirubrobacteraceae bacterium]|nr:DUF4349 domain-containing protein [Solirubrobacteraceae bacterium]
MPRRDPEALPAEVERDLAEIERALVAEAAPAAGTPAELALTLRDDRPAPAPGFAAELDRRAAAGFPRRARHRPRIAARPAFALAGAGALAVMVSVALLTGDGDRAGGPALPVAPEGDVATLERAAPEASPSPRAGSEAPAAQTAPVTPAVPGRAVERSAELQLATPADGLDEAAAGVVRTVDALGGYVVSSNVTGGGGGGQATFALRVPVARLGDAMARLSRLGDVRSRSESSQDLTGRVAAARERLDALRAERRGVLRQLAAATTPQETARARDRLRRLDARIARAQAARAELGRRAAFSSISVGIEADGPAAGGGAGAWTLGDAWRDALGVLRTALGGLLVALAAALPLAIVAAPLWAGRRALVARRRRTAQDAPA